MKKPCIYFCNIFHASSQQWKETKPKINKPIKQTNKTHTQNKHLLNDSPVTAQSLMEVSYFNHRQTILHKDTFMMFKLGSYYVPQVCMCIFVFIQSIPFKMFDLLEYCLDPISCILEFSCTSGLPQPLNCLHFCHLPALQQRHTNHSCLLFSNTLQNFPLNVQCSQIISQFIKNKRNFKNQNGSGYSRQII